MKRTLTTGAIAALVGGELRGQTERSIARVLPLDRSAEDAISFIATSKYLPYLQATQAGAVLVPQQWLDDVPQTAAAIAVPDPHSALRRVLLELHPPATPPPGIHPTALIADSAKIGTGVYIGPFAVIGEKVEIGAGVSIGSHVVVGAGCVIGGDVQIHPHVALYEGVRIGDRVIVHSGARIGCEGFGYVWEYGGHRKVPQVGGCVIESDVEIGANATIDRGSIGDTVVGSGSKIDNLVHLGHNVQIGRHVIMVAQVGISGSTSIGDGAVLGGQVGVGGHLQVGPRARLAGQAGVIGDVPAGATYSGYPARPHREALRAQAGLFKLPELMRRLKRLEERILGSNREHDANEEGIG